MSTNSKGDPASDRAFRSNYRRKLLSPADWIGTADALLQTAQLLEEEVTAIWHSMREWHATKDKRKLKPDGLLSVYLMLVAFAVENLLKAALVGDFARDLREEFDSSEKLPALLRTHDLFKLATKAALPITVEEEIFSVFSLVRRFGPGVTLCRSPSAPCRVRKSFQMASFGPYLISAVKTSLD